MNTTMLIIKDLTPADYNPRKISDKQLSMLKKALYEFGDLGGIVYNRRTGQMVGGHQRTKCIPKDAVIEKESLPEPDRCGTIAHGYILLDGTRFSYREVDWDEAREKAANIAANRNGGEWDTEGLEAILKELAATEINFDLELTGFSNEDVNRMLESFSPMHTAFSRSGTAIQGDDEVENAPREKYPLTFILSYAEYEAWQEAKEQADIRDDKKMLLKLVGGDQC